MKIFWFDTETSGLSPVKNGIISLSYMIEIDGTVTETGNLYFNCRGKQIEESALSVNGFTREQIEGFPDPENMYRELNTLFSRYISKFDKNDKFTAAGYNVGFDVDFLRQLWSENGDKYFGSWFAFGVIDPSQIIRFLQYCGYSFPVRAKLTDIASSLGIGTDNAHDASADIGMTREVVQVLKKYIKQS